MTRKPHRNGRGLFLGAVLGAVAGYFAGRMFGNAALGIILGAAGGLCPAVPGQSGSLEPALTRRSQPAVHRPLGRSAAGHLP